MAGTSIGCLNRLSLPPGDAPRNAAPQSEEILLRRPDFLLFWLALITSSFRLCSPLLRSFWFSFSPVLNYATVFRGARPGPDSSRLEPLASHASFYVRSGFHFRFSCFELRHGFPGRSARARFKSLRTSCLSRRLLRSFWFSLPCSFRF